MNLMHAVFLSQENTERLWFVTREIKAQQGINKRNAVFLKGPFPEELEIKTQSNHFQIIKVHF